MIENEVKILEIDTKKWSMMLEKMGATKVGNWEQKRQVYDFHPINPKKWIRLRTNGEKTTLTIKEIIDNTKINGVQELEIEVSDYEKTAKILEELGFHANAVQENKRICYRYEDVEIAIDTWPLIPTYVEIEGPNVEAVEKFLNKIDYDEQKKTTLDVKSIYREFYGILIDQYPNLTFQEK